MLHFLTDEHISPVVAEQALIKCPGIKITAFRSWREGYFLGTRDIVFLPEATRDGLTLVSYDQRTIPVILKGWAEAGFDHAGVVFVDEKSLAPQDFGGLIRALCYLWKSERGAEWTNRVVFLQAPPK
jgi:hypothetical protein